MSVVRELPRYSVPGHCIMFPGRRRDERGFYLFDTVLDGPHGDMHVGISGEALRTIAERHPQLGVVRVERAEAAERELAAAQARIVELEDQVAELQDFKDRIAGFTADGFEVRRKQGRPPVTKEKGNA